jgi:alpha-galactosidase
MSRLRRGRLFLVVTVGLLIGIATSSVMAALAGGHGAESLAQTEPTLLPGTIALAPPMGWNGYNHYGRRVTESIVEAEARALVRSGMKAAGYEYVNLDGGWALPWRSSEGKLLANPFKFPHGIKAVADYVHSLGLKFGIYTSAGMLNCAGTSAGSFGHYRQDVATFASWGVDYVKFDWCRVPYSRFRNLSDLQVARQLIDEMGAAIAAAGRPMLYDVNSTDVGPWTWAPPAASIWRTSTDIKATFQSLLWNFRENVVCYSLARPGRWNDPDMLEIGNHGLTPIEEQAQFSLWAEMAAPLIAGNDLTEMTPAVRAILTNVAVIAVDQDPLGQQGYAVASVDGHWVLTRPLANGDRAVVLFNATNKAAVITTTVEWIGLTGDAPAYWLVNLWTNTKVKTAGVIAARVPPHGAVMLAVTAA